MWISINIENQANDHVKLAQQIISEFIGYLSLDPRFISNNVDIPNHMKIFTKLLKCMITITTWSQNNDSLPQFIEKCSKHVSNTKTVISSFLADTDPYKLSVNPFDYLNEVVTDRFIAGLKWAELAWSLRTRKYRNNNRSIFNQALIERRKLFSKRICPKCKCRSNHDIDECTPINKLTDIYYLQAMQFDKNFRYEISNFPIKTHDSFVRYVKNVYRMKTSDFVANPQVKK